MANDCVKRLLDPEIQKNLFGDKKVPKSVIESLVKDIEEIRNTTTAEMGPSTYRSRVQKYLEQQRVGLEYDKAWQGANFRKLHDGLDFLTGPKNLEFLRQTGLYENPVEGFLSTLGKSLTIANGSTNGLENQIRARQSTLMSMLHAGLEITPGNLKIAASGELDKEITQAVWAMRSGKPTEGLSRPAIEIATAINNVQKKLYNDQRMADMPVHELNNRASMRTYDPAKVTSMGKEQFIAEIRKLNIDRDATFGAAAGNAEKEAMSLGAIYEKVILSEAGTEASLDPTAMAEMLNPKYETKGSTAKALSASRNLYFADAESEHAFNVMFGKGNVYQTTMSEIAQKARAIAVVEKLGLDPDTNIRRLMDAMSEMYKKDGRPDLAEQLVNSKIREEGDARYNQRILNEYRQTMGYSNIPHKQAVAKTYDNLRLVQSLSKLSMSGVKSLGNMANTAVRIQDISGRNIMQAWGSTLKNFIEQFPASNRKVVETQLGTFMGDFHGDFLQRSGAGQPGFGGKMLGVMMQANGTKYLSEAAETAISKMFMEDAGRGLTGKMTPELKTSFLTMGFTPDALPLLAKAVETGPGGRKLLTQEGIRNLGSDPELKGLIASLAKEKGISPEKYIRETEVAYASFLHTQGLAASSTASVRENSLLHGNAQRGTHLGELRITAMQFKNFALQAFNSFVETSNMKADPELLSRGVVQAKGNNLGSQAQLLVGLTAMGFVAKAISDSLKGKNIEDPTNPKTWLNAMANGGAGGIVADMLMTDYSKFGKEGAAANIMLGPTFGQALPLFQATTAKGFGGLESALDSTGKTKGQVFSKGMARDYLKLARNNIPFQNAPVLRDVLDKVQKDYIEQALGLGSSKASRKKYEAADKKGRTAYPWGK